jgi:hypothetical protein
MVKQSNLIRLALIGLVVIAAITALVIGIGIYSDLKNNRLSGRVISDVINNNRFPSGIEFPKPAKFAVDIETGGIRLNSRTKDSYFYIKKDGVWNCTFLKGVNIGLTLPTTDLTNPDIPYQTYITWFNDIKNMNANTVKVFTIMNPDFYRALYDYNTNNPDNPLYLLQGVWFNESWMETIGDAFGENQKILNQFTRAVIEASDIIHGNSDYTSYGKIEKAVYDRDVSQYTVGYVLGLEWLPGFVKTTNENNAEIKQFSGKYLTTFSASPFEIFLAHVGEALIKHETEIYFHQTPVAFLNWPTTDTLKHSNEPFPEEDLVSVNTEAIRSTSEYYAGLFAAVDVYPYYPEFMNFQPEYLEFKDENRVSNPYRAYLRDLRGQYSVPVIVAEFGVPTSRGVAHKSSMGYNQGGISEDKQGEIISAMSLDIALERYAGAIIFAWQDEWFKQTWNTVRYAPKNPLQRGLNVESAEQRYGILAYDPGRNQSVCYPDGDINEWNGTQPVSTTQDGLLYAKTDEGFLYLMLKLTTEWDNRKYCVPISLTGHGNLKSNDYQLVFNRPVDFLLILDGKNNTRLMTDAYYDRFYFQYSVQKNIFERNKLFEKQNSGLFNSIRTFISNEMVLPLTNQTIPPGYYESGLLRFGNSNPKSSNFDSLADFYAVGNLVEIRIPWYLVNVTNGCEKMIMDDFYATGKVSFKKQNNLFLGVCALDRERTVNLEFYEWNEIKKSEYHMRLKKSYNIIGDFYKELMNGYS